MTGLKRRRKARVSVVQGNAGSRSRAARLNPPVTLSEQLRTEDPSSPSSPPPRGARRGPSHRAGRGRPRGARGDRVPRRARRAGADREAAAALGHELRLPQRAGGARSRAARRCARSRPCRAARARSRSRSRAPRSRPARGWRCATGRVEAGRRSRDPRARCGRAPRATRSRVTLPRDVLAQVCLRQLRGTRRRVLGSKRQDAGSSSTAGSSRGAISMAYYRPGEERLISMLPEIARRIGRTRGHLGGAWRGVAVLVLFGGAVGLSAWLLVGLARGGAAAPGRASWSALVAGFNALAWGLLTPIVPDRPTSRSTSPTSRTSPSTASRRARRRTRCRRSCTRSSTAPQVGDLNFNPFGRGLWSADADAPARQGARHQADTGQRARERQRPRLPARVLRRARARPTASAHAAGGSTLDALTFMRAIGALFAMVTVLALLAMLRELFPDRPLLTGGVGAPRARSSPCSPGSPAASTPTPR